MDLRVSRQRTEIEGFAVAKGNDICKEIYVSPCLCEIRELNGVALQWTYEEVSGVAVRRG